jgi:superfamily II DNA/RNA helicase
LNYAHCYTHLYTHTYINIRNTTAQDPAFFIHRVGRAARAGRRGQSLTLLSPEEDAYIEFLALRRVPLTEVPHSWDFAAAAAAAVSSDSDDTAADTDAAAASASADFESEAESSDDESDDVSMSDSPEGEVQGEELPPGGADVSAMSAEDAAAAEQDAAVLQRARQLVRSDRDLLEKGTRAFVAFVRAYKVS